MSPTGSVVSKMTVEPAWMPGAIAATAASIERWSGCDVASSMTGTIEDDDVGLARRRGAVQRRPEPAGGVGFGHELREPGLLADVRATRR